MVAIYFSKRERVKELEWKSVKINMNYGIMRIMTVYARDCVEISRDYTQSHNHIYRERGGYLFNSKFNSINYLRFIRRE